MQPYNLRSLLAGLALSLLVVACTEPPAPTELAASPTAPLPGVPTLAPTRPAPAATGTRSVAPFEASATPTDRPRASATPQPAANQRPLIVGGLVSLEGLGIDGGPTEPLTALIRASLYGSLMRPNPETLALEPALATTWEATEGEVTFRLGPDATWNDGRPLTAEAVGEALLAARDRGAGRWLYLLRDAEANDARTLTLRFEGEPLRCAALSEAATWPLVAGPGDGVPERTTGPYTVAPDDAALPGLREGWRFTPREGEATALGSWRYLVFSDPGALRAAWEAGQVDLIVGDRWLGGDVVPAGAPGSQPADVVSELLAVLAFRQDHPILDDRALRQALALGTDPLALYTASYGAPPPEPLTALLPPGHWAAPDEAPAVDVEAARDQLDALGWTDADGDGLRSKGDETLRFSVTLAYSNDARWESLALALRAQWAELGVVLEPRYGRPVTVEEWLQKGYWDVALLPYRVPFDPDQGALWETGEGLMATDMNVTRYSNTAVAEALTEAGTIPGCEAEARRPRYLDAWARITEDVPMRWLFPLPHRLFLGPNVAPPPGGAAADWTAWRPWQE